MATETKYSPMNPDTWNGKDDSRQLRVTDGPTKMPADIIPGDALWDAGVEVWRGVVATETRGPFVWFRFEDGGALGIKSDVATQVSETGLRGWSSGASASAALKAGGR